MRTKLFLLLSILGPVSILLPASASAQTVSGAKAICRSSAFPAFTFGESNVFPKDRVLRHPEDGKALADGRVIVGDEEFGLRVIDKTGKSKAFGKFKQLGWVHDPPKVTSGPNGLFMENDGRHLLLADVYSGKLYRIDTVTEETRMIYDHPYGINSVARDSEGTIWFTQSANNTDPAEMWQSVNRPIDSGAIYHLRGSGDQVDLRAVQSASNIYFANGIAIDKAEHYLYVAETMMDRVIRFRIDIRKRDLSERELYQPVLTPDNLAFDRDGNLWIASPIGNKIFAVDNKCRSLHTIFQGGTAGSARIQNEWTVRSRQGKPLIDLLGPELSQPLPGVITGMFWSRDRKTFYITGLGNAILKFD